MLIRAEDLSRDVVKHLNHMEEQILESMAWRSNSPLWEVLENSRQPIPSCEDVSLPSQIYPQTPSSTPVPTEQASHVKSTPQQLIPYSPSTYHSVKRAESSLAACKLTRRVSGAF